MRHQRTKGQNEIVVFKLLDLMSSGSNIKEAAASLTLPLYTARSILLRYQKRQKFITITQMLAAHVILKAWKVRT